MLRCGRDTERPSAVRRATQSQHMHLAVGGALAKAGTALFLVLASTTLLCLLRRGSTRSLSLLQEAADQMEMMERRAAALGEELAAADGAAGAAVARRRAEAAGDRSALFWPGTPLSSLSQQDEQARGVPAQRNVKSN
ncbi:hypothetical protein GE061_003329 [Apolygus lucorum]|uniref:Uncharacterized protein n=1 Tax=Apolygus lucorum TaxID=248454 RepID=A0A6A4JMR7_APOLU|nr:hypothetical protein GE061_003329 [Apolygus lucorum]